MPMDPLDRARMEAEAEALRRAVAMTPDERARRKAELQREMERDRAAWEAEKASDWRLRATERPAQTPGAPAAMLPPPSPPTLASGTPPPSDGGVVDYLMQTAGNVPGDAARVGQGMWQGIQAAADDPLGTLRSMGEGALGVMQTATVDPRRTVDPRWDFRPEAGMDRYGAYDMHNIADTFRDRPVQTALDLGGLAALTPARRVWSGRSPGAFGTRLYLPACRSRASPPARPDARGCPRDNRGRRRGTRDGRQGEAGPRRGRSRVVLPQPFRPTSPSLRRAPICAVTPSKRRRPSTR